MRALLHLIRTRLPNQGSVDAETEAPSSGNPELPKGLGSIKGDFLPLTN